MGGWVGVGMVEVEGEGVPGQFSTSGIYEALRYAVMQKGILKLTKRPLVQAFFLSFFSRISSSVLGTIFRRAADCFHFYEAFCVRFKTWRFALHICILFCLCSSRSPALLNCSFYSVSHEAFFLFTPFPLS